MSSEMFSELRNAIAKIVDAPENEWVFLTKYLRSITLRKKEHMIQEGSVCRQIGFVTQGVLRSYLLNDGDEIVNEFFWFNRVYYANVVCYTKIIYATVAHSTSRLTRH